MEVHDSTNVVLENVAISGATMDGVHARRSSLTIRRCNVSMKGDYTQGIDISFAFDLPPSSVSKCRVVGGRKASSPTWPTWTSVTTRFATRRCAESP